MPSEWRQFIKSVTEDDWTHVTDRAERKKIQNRLAQRAHRSKYGRRRKAKTVPPPGTKHFIATPQVHDTASASAQLKGIAAEGNEISPGSGLHSFSASVLMHGVTSTIHCDDFNDSFIMHNDAAGNLIPLPSLTTNLTLSLPGMLTFAALLTNKYILAIDCSQLVPSINIQPSTPTPPALTPTTLQSCKPHLPFIDFLPFPQFRDNLLRAGEDIESREFWNDMISGKLRVWGKTPWDRRGWEMSEEFVAKWWWVIADDILEETNFWRVSRGEAPLLPRLTQIHKHGEAGDDSS